MSISQATKQAIGDVVGDFLCDEKVFTAYNVSKEVQSRGIRERHLNMRDEIHSEISEVNVYHVKTSLTLDNGKQVNVYHLPEHNPIDFLDEITVGNSNAKVVSKRTVDLSPTRTQVFKNADVISPDGRSRVCVPHSHTQKIGLKYGDKVIVSSHPTLEIVKISPDDSNASSGRSYRVDKSGNVRIARSILENAKIEDTDVRISVINGSIVVEGV